MCRTFVSIELHTVGAVLKLNVAVEKLDYTIFFAFLNFYATATLQNVTEMRAACM